MNNKYDPKAAIAYFWDKRSAQNSSQGLSTGQRDQGNRTAVTGGAQLDGFVQLLKTIIFDAGIENSQIYTNKGKTVLPGYYRPTKNWDIVVVSGETLLAAVEFKSHVGPSFGNNYNNRVEEALGNSTDIRSAYREGMFAPSSKPWLGWLMLLEDDEGSRSPVRISEPHFKARKDFANSSYADRYEVFCKSLIRDQLYDAACLLLSERVGGLTGTYSEPSTEIGFRRFATSLYSHALAFAEMNS